jgi:hypothetical protein
MLQRLYIGVRMNYVVLEKSVRVKSHPRKTKTGKLSMVKEFARNVHPGAKHLYHGTIQSTADRIIENGIEPRYTDADRDFNIYATDNFEVAMYFGMVKAREKTHNPNKAVVAIVVIDRSGFTKTDVHFFTSKKAVPPERIVRAELYKYSDVKNYMTSHGNKPTPFKIISKELE